MKAVTYADGKPREGDVPADVADQVKEYREKLVEAAAETDDDLLNKYLEEGSLGEAEMLKALRAGIGRQAGASAGGGRTKTIGTAALLDLLVESFLAPRSRRGERHRPQDQAGGHRRRTQGAR